MRWVAIWMPPSCRKSRRLDCRPPAISIVADGVTLRGNGYSLTNSAGLQNRGVGIHALNRSNITIEQMTIRGNGNWYPIYLQDDRGYRSGKHVIRQNRLTGTFRGARIEGSDNTDRIQRILGYRRTDLGTPAVPDRA